MPSCSNNEFWSSTPPTQKIKIRNIKIAVQKEKIENFPIKAINLSERQVSKYVCMKLSDYLLK